MSHPEGGEGVSDCVGKVLDGVYPYMEGGANGYHKAIQVRIGLFNSYLHQVESPSLYGNGGSRTLPNTMSCYAQPYVSITLFRWNCCPLGTSWAPGETLTHSSGV